MKNANWFVVTLSHKKRWLEDNPGLAKTRINVVNSNTFRKLVSDGVGTLNQGKRRFKRVLITGDDAPQAFDKKYEAYRYVLERLELLKKNGRSVEFEDEVGSQVYIIELNEMARSYRKMKKHNSSKLLENSSTCLYVGLTTKETPEQRYDQHRQSRDVDESTTWGREYFLTPFDRAYRRDLLLQYEEETGLKLFDLKNSEAHVREFEVTEWLRQSGYAAYSA